MKEALFILAVILVLAGLTAFRYRKQISGLIEIARTLRKIGGALSGGHAASGRIEGRGGARSGDDTALVKCSTCGVWSPQERARRNGEYFYCSDECLRTRVR